MAAQIRGHKKITRLGIAQAANMHRQRFARQNSAAGQGRQKKYFFI